MSLDSLAERKATYRHRVESQETYRDYVIDIVGVWGPLLAPAVPAALTMVSIAMHYPELLDIHWLAALVIGLIVAVVIEVLGVVSVETFLDMKSYNQIITDEEESAPAGWAGAIMGLYIAIVLSLVVLLKMVPALALVSLVPLTLLAGVTSWIVVMRKQHRHRVYRKELAGMEEKRQTDLATLVETLRSELEMMKLNNGKLIAENQHLSSRIEAMQSQISTFENDSLPIANAARFQNVESRRAAIAKLLEMGLSATVSEIQEKLQEAGFTSGIGDRTIRDDLKALGANRAGHKWSLPAHQPESDEQTNGVLIHTA